MSGMGGTMSTVWMRMPGQSWPGAAASFLAMWVAMMVAMMLPSLAPMLWRYRAGCVTVLVGMGYFLVWTVLGAVVFPLGVALSMMGMRQPLLARAEPFAVAVVVLIAGALQLTRWKARRLACRGELGRPEPKAPALERSEGKDLHSAGRDAGMAWRHGVRLGIDCAQCCAGLMAIPLVAGIMDLRVMGAVTVAVTAERLAPARMQVARGVGVAGVGAGAMLIARAAGLG